MIEAGLLCAWAALGAPSAVPQDAIDARARAAAAGLVELRRDLHREPELANREFRTGKLLAARLRALGLEVRWPVAHTGVIGILRGRANDAAVLLRADIDALPLQEESDAPYRSRRPGVMHACGHDVHAAVVLGVAEVLAGLRERLPGSVVFLFQPAEEGPPVDEDGGAALVLREGALGGLPLRAVLGLHVDPQLPAGRVGWTQGAVFASRDSFAIEITGRVAHGASAERGVDAIRVAAEIVTGLGALAAAHPEASLTVGTIEGGAHPGLVAGSARLRGVLRVADESGRAALKEGLERVVREASGARGARGVVSYADAGVPALRNDAVLVASLLPILKAAVGADSLTEVGGQMGAEDFALYAQRYPACYVKLGVRNDAQGIVAPLHTDRFDVDEAAIEVGVRTLAALAWGALLAGL